MPNYERKKIIVVGSERLENSYLGVSLDLDGFKVGYMEFQDFVETSPENLQNYFCLIDFQCEKKEIIMGGLGILAQVCDTVSFRYALFNVCPNHICEEQMIGLIRQGLIGLFFDGENLEMVCRGVRRIMEGDIWLPRKLMMQMILADRASSLQVNGLGHSSVVEAQARSTCASTSLKDIESKSDQKAIGILTIREKEVLAKLAAGLSNQDIAEQLFISIPTVKSHTKNIYEKVGVSSRLQAALWLAKNG